MYKWGRKSWYLIITYLNIQYQIRSGSTPM